MSRVKLKSVLLAAAATALCAMGSVAGAQDHPQDNPAEHSDHHVMRADDHGDEHRIEDPTIGYRHDHPHASARCHDGFFTTTKDRGRACTKHGGIDVWLAL
jgi:Protein of unknown function (DUF3761)